MRYRIWDPEDHFYARQQMPEKVLDPNVPMREKTWGTVHDVLEDVGPGPERLILEFRYPHELGYEEESRNRGVPDYDVCQRPWSYTGRGRCRHYDAYGAQH